MTKAELVTQVAQATQLTQHQTAAIVARFRQCIIEALQAGDTVELRGFGRFRCRQRRARQGRNPKTGVLVAVPAQTVPVFTVGKALHVRLNPGLTPASPLTGESRIRPRRAGRQRRAKIPSGR